jgi:hypothetical protein
VGGGIHTSAGRRGGRSTFGPILPPPLRPRRSGAGRSIPPKAAPSPPSLSSSEGANTKWEGRSPSHPPALLPHIAAPQTKQPTNQPTNQPGRQPAARRIPPNHTTPHNLTEIPTQKKHAKRCRTTHPSPRGIHDEINCELPLKPSRPTHFLDVPIESGNALWHCTSMARKSYAEIQQGQRRT